MKKRYLTGLAPLLAAGIITDARAGTATFDFNTDPAGVLNIQGAGQWRPTGGVGNTGYLSITDAIGGQASTIVFDDFDAGAVVKSFVFSCDLRTGGGTSPPADGYSVSFAREDDPVVLNGTGFAGINAETNLPEEGTTTGVSIGLDEWFSGGSDVIGISVRVDGVLVNQTSLPTLNGSATDTTSLQTGPAGVPVDADYNVPGHSFVNLTIRMDDDGTLDVSYKGRDILSNFATSYFPSRGRIVLAGRTGGSNSNHHVDNISITTTAATLPTLTALAMTASSMTATVVDSATSVLDASKPVSATIDGTTVPVTVTKAGGTTTISYALAPPAFYSNAAHPVVLKARDVNNNPIEFTRDVTPAVYFAVDSSWKAAAGTVDTSVRGFRARINQLSFARFPGDTNLLPLPERQMAQGYFNSPLGILAPNQANPGPEGDGSYILTGGIDLDEANSNGNFPAGSANIPGIPGPSGSLDNITGEFVAWLDLPAGLTRLGVNSDDGFTVSFGSSAIDFFRRSRAGVFDGGRGAADTLFDVAVPVAGLYPVRLLWWEGGGGANVEFFSVTPAGEKILIDDSANASGIKAYYKGLTPSPSLHNIAPYPSSVDNDPRHPILIELIDGVAAVNDSSIVLTVNGSAVTPQITNLAQITSLSFAPPGNRWLPDSKNTVSLTYKDANAVSRTETWTFNVGHYLTLTAADSAKGTPSLPGYTARIYQVASRDGEASGVGTENWNEVTDDILAGLYGPNVADLSAAGPDGIFRFSGTLDWDQDSNNGNFTTGSANIPGIPGTTGSNDNIAAEILTNIAFPAPGVYVMGVNSDDGFRLTLGQKAPSRHLLQLTGSATLTGPMGSIDGTRAFASIGQPITGVVEGALVAANPLIADTPLTNAAAVAGKIVYIDRGTVAFAAKLLNAQNAGAIGAIIGNNNGGYPSIMGGDSTGITIPAVMVSRADGTRIKDALTAGDPLRASFGYDTTPRFGEFSGGRGAADTTFLVDVQAAGTYPVRLTWKEGGGGANCEWFSVLPSGTKVLINDPAATDSLKAYQVVATPVTIIPITNIAVNRGARTFDLTWVSSPGETYQLEHSKNLNDVWTLVTPAIPASAAGTTTSFHGDFNTNPALPNVGTETRYFFRVRRL